LEYEQLRRKIESQARELSYFTTDQMNKIAYKLSDDDKQKWQNVMARFADQNRSVLEIETSLLLFNSSQSSSSFYS
jgi:hypothetical protein